MRIEYRNIRENSDCEGPVLDIIFENSGDAFNLGKIFQMIINENRCAWEGSNYVRIPLVETDRFGKIKKIVEEK